MPPTALTTLPLYPKSELLFVLKADNGTLSKKQFIPEHLTISANYTDTICEPAEACAPVVGHVHMEDKGLQTEFPVPEGHPDTAGCSKSTIRIRKVKKAVAWTAVVLLFPLTLLSMIITEAPQDQNDPYDWNNDLLRPWRYKTDLEKEIANRNGKL